MHFHYEPDPQQPAGPLTSPLLCPAGDALEACLRQARVPYYGDCELFIWRNNLPKKVRAEATRHLSASKPVARAESSPLCTCSTYPASPQFLQGGWKGGKRGRRAEDDDDHGGSAGGRVEEEEEVPAKPDSIYLILKGGRQRSAEYR